MHLIALFKCSLQEVTATVAIDIPMTMNMIRLATLEDVPQMAKVFGDGFIDDDVFGNFMHPKRREYPEDWLRCWKRDLASHLLSPRARCYVYVNRQGDVAGCMMMARIGKGGKAETTNEIPDVQEYLDSLSATDRSADPQAMAAFDRNWEDIRHHFSGDRAECWMIEMLCIHPDWQKMGCGRDLIQAAISLVESESTRLPLCVIASEVADGFYEKYGFHEVGRANVGALAGVHGGSLKFYEDQLR